MDVSALLRAPVTARPRALTARGVVRLQTARGSTVCDLCAIAHTAPARMRGLLGRSSLRPGEGMLIRPAPSVHTFFMRFPIDVVFLDREARVLKIAASLRPWRVASCRRAVAVLELRAGAAAACGLEIGDMLEVGGGVG
jgi:uncharacterized membrane protein (UPF0127 family)